jgi:hypothetical protein
MEAIMDTKGLNKPCECGSGKQAGSCCRKEEPCTCESGKKAGECCYRETPAAKKK